MAADALEADGVDDEIQFLTGLLSDFTHGTIVVRVRRLSDGANQAVLAPTGAGLRTGFTQFNDFVLIGDGGDSVVSGAAGTDWRTLIWRKGAGSVIPRLSRLNGDTLIWSHNPGHAAMPDGVAPGAGGRIQFAVGQFMGRGHFRIAAAMIFKNRLPWPADATGDATIQTIDWSKYQVWLNQLPDAAWRLNTLGTIVDDTGNGADEASRVGMTLVNDPDLTFDYTMNGGTPSCTASIPLTLSTSATAEATHNATTSIPLTVSENATAEAVHEATTSVPLTLSTSATVEAVHEATAEVPLSLDVAATTDAPTLGTPECTASIPLSLSVAATAEATHEITTSIPLALSNSAQAVATHEATTSISMATTMAASSEAVHEATAAIAMTLAMVAQAFGKDPKWPVTLKLISLAEPLKLRSLED